SAGIYVISAGFLLETQYRFPQHSHNGTGFATELPRMSTGSLSGLLKDVGDAFTRMSIPKRRYHSLFCSSRKDVLEFAAEPILVFANKDVRAHGHCDWTFSIRPDRQARNAKVSSLLLDPPRIGNHHRGATLQ